MTDQKPVFGFYMSAIYFALNKPKEALLHLEKAMSTTPKMLKKLIELNPSLLRHPQVVDIAARYKRNKSI
jgi:hypothetical protein